VAVPADRPIEHLLRRAGFGARPDELASYRRLSVRGAIDAVVNYQRIPDEVDSKKDQPGYVSVTSAGAYRPSTVIADARQRWLFRMLHTNRPLEEKMTLFWHNHFATGYAKIAGMTGQATATVMMAGDPRSPDNVDHVRGQIEMLRQNALGSFEELLVNIARDPAMLFWLDGNQNVRNRPQENFARELMELFTMGVGHFTEPDVYAAARVFTGWSVRQVVTRPVAEPDRNEFQFIPNNHDTADKTFTFAIYPDGRRTIPARAAADGQQDGLDLIAALAAHPETVRALARKLYRFFVADTGDVPNAFVNRVTNTYRRTRYSMRAVMHDVFNAPEFWDERAYFGRHASPVEFVIRSLKDVGWSGFSLGTTLGPLVNMGQNLFDPPDVNGWEGGPLWFSTGAMLARMNFAAALARNQQINLAADARPHARSPEALLAYVSDRVRTAPLSRAVEAELASYLQATGPWSGSPAQLQMKVPGLVHLLASTPEYQFS
jgi:uncharacterized protein (DUF1800 family)